MIGGYNLWGMMLRLFANVGREAGKSIAWSENAAAGLMTRYLSVTTCSAEQWLKYGRAMVATYRRYWPTEVPLWLYAEAFWPDEIKGDPVPFRTINLDVAAPWLAPFKAAHDKPQYMGGQGRRDYRRDAVRFAHKIAALGAAVDGAEEDVLIWLDADIVTHAKVTTEWLDGLFPQPAGLAWLDRMMSYPECGFMMFRLPEAKRLITKVVEMYRDGGVFKLPEHHDSYVFQHLANIMASKGKLKIHSLSGEGRVHTGHPFCNSRVAECLDHLKGESRKAAGHSLATDVKVPRSEPYWQRIMGSR